MDRTEMKRKTHRKTLSGSWKGWRSTGCALVVLLLAAGCQEEASDAGGVPAIRKISLGYPALSATVFPLVYAQEKGIFEQEGVEVEMTRIRGVARIVATLISGDIDVGWMGFDGMTNAVSQGAEELRYVGEFLKELPQSLMVAPHIKTFDDLRGQTIATAGTALVMPSARLDMGRYPGKRKFTRRWAFPLRISPPSICLFARPCNPWVTVVWMQP